MIACARLLAAICVLAACGKDAPPPPAREAPTEPPEQAERADAPALVFLGDSLTAGRGLSAAQSMPARVEARIVDAGLDLRVVNAGRSGDTTAGGLSRLSWYLRDEVKLGAIVIGLGSNDAMRGLPLAEMEQNLREIVRRVKAYDAEVGVYLFAMKTFPNMGAQYAGAYEDVFARVAREEGAVLLPFPLEGVAADPALNQSDGIHPNVEGTERMADNVWRALAPHLRASERGARPGDVEPDPAGATAQPAEDASP